MGLNGYERTVDARGIVRYKLDGRLVKALEVPADVKTTLDDEAALSAVTETTPEVAEPETIEDISEDSVVETPPIDTSDDVDDDSGIDDEMPTSVVASTGSVITDGFGFKMVKGKTVDIFDGVTPHETIRLVSGLTVPLTLENYRTKTDAEIQLQLKKLKKI